MPADSNHETAKENSVEDYPLAPVDPAEEAEIVAARQQETQIPLPAAQVDLSNEPTRFSVRDIFVLTTFAAVLLAGMQLLQPQVFAGVLGIVSFISLVLLTILRVRLAIIHIGWWVLLGVYLIASVVALARG